MRDGKLPRVRLTFDRRQEPCALTRPHGSVRGAPGNRRPYRDVRQANWQKVGGASPLERRSNRTTFLREPCVGSREGAGEASVAVRMGRAALAPERQAPPAAKTQELPVSTASAGRSRKAASSTARGKTPSPTLRSRKRTVEKAQNTSVTKTAVPPSDIRPTGKWVARLRRRHGLSVAQFAGQLGVSAVTVYRWEATPGLLKLHARPLNALMALYRQGRTKIRGVKVADIDG